MFEDLMSLMAGFLTAYLILRAVRSFRGGVGLLILFLGCGSVRATTIWTFHNNSTCNGYFCVKFGSYGCDTSCSASAGGSCGMSVCFAGTWYWQFHRNSDGAVVDGGTFVDACSGGDIYTSGGSLCGVTYTNYFACINFVAPGGSNVLSDQYAKLTFYTNGLVAGVQSLNIGPGGTTNSLCMTNPIPGWSGPWTYSLLGPGNGTNDFVPILLGTNSASGSSGVSLNPSGVIDNPNWQNPVNNIPQDPSVTNYNPAVLTQVQNQALINSIGNLQGALQAGDKSITNLLATINNTVSTNQLGLSTNVSDAGTHSALGVVTNQLGALQNLSSNLNLGLMGNGSNVAGLLPTIASNTATAGWGVVSNALYNSALTDWQAASNQLRSGWSSEMGGIQGTNSTVQTNVDTPGGEGNLTVGLVGPGGVSYSLDFNPFHQTSGPWLAFLQAIPWIRYWASWAIAFAVWWLCVQRLDELVISGSLAAAMSASKGVGSAAGYGLKIVAGPFVAVLITAAIASLPTAAMAWMTTRGITNPLSAPSFLGTLGDIGPLGSSFTVMVEEFANFLLVVWPFDVLLVGFANWVTFYFTAGFFYRMMTAALRCMGMYVPLFAVGFWYLQVRGEQLRFENFTGAAVVVSNGARVLSLPPGVSDKVVIPYGNWITASNGFTVNADGYQVVRAYGDTNNVGVVYFEQADGYSAYQWWMWGMNCGFLIFGTTWAISAARSGILLRVRE